jgi:hypothetical protein
VEEWLLMREGRMSPHAALAAELRRSIQDFEPRIGAEQALRSEGLEQLDDLDGDRALRLLEVREGLPIMWVVLIIGGVLTVAFTYLCRDADPLVVQADGRSVGRDRLLYPLHNRRPRLSAYPFNGGLRVEPDAFELVA